MSGDPIPPRARLHPISTATSRMRATNRNIASYTAGGRGRGTPAGLVARATFAQVGLSEGYKLPAPHNTMTRGRGGRHQWRPSDGPCRRCRLPQRCCGAGMAGPMLGEFDRLDASHGIGENSEGGPALPQSSIFYVRRRSYIRWCVSPHVVSWPRILAQVTALATISSMTLSVYKDRLMVYSAYSYSWVSSSSTTSSSSPSPS